MNRNRLANVKNEFQGDAKKVLCVCSAGLLRSPTAAWILSNPPFNFNTRAVGTSEEFALIPLDPIHLVWADEVVVMNVDQFSDVMDMAEEFGIQKHQKGIIMLDIPDNFSFREPELVQIMTETFLDIFINNP